MASIYDRVAPSVVHIRVVQRVSGAERPRIERPGWPDFVFSFHEREEIGPRMLARMAKRTGLTPEDL